MIEDLGKGGVLKWEFQLGSGGGVWSSDTDFSTPKGRRHMRKTKRERVKRGKRALKYIGGSRGRPHSTHTS